MFWLSRRLSKVEKRRPDESLQLPEDLQETYQALVEESPLPKDIFQRHINPVVQKVFALVDSLPASASYHHAEVNGLMLHTLEVAKEMQRRSRATVFTKRTLSVSETKSTELRWQVAACLLGLIHDIGKVPCDWQCRNQSDCFRLFLDWSLKDFPIREMRPNRVHKSHELFSVAMMGSLISADTWAFLGEEISNAMILAFSDSPGQLGLLLKQSDGESVHKAQQKTQFVYVNANLPPQAIPIPVPEIKVVKKPYDIREILKNLREQMESGHGPWLIAPVTPCEKGLETRISLQALSEQSGVPPPLLKGLLAGPQLPPVIRISGDTLTLFLEENQQ